jgi:hypothetical protein
MAAITLLAAVLAVGAAQAEGDSSATGNGERGGRRGPPPEAFDACVALVEGDSCSFASRCDKEVTGTCVKARNDELVCRPADRGRHGHGKARDEQDSDDDDGNENDS